MRINPGDLGADYSFARPATSDLANQGVRFVCRYLSPDPTKNLGADERDALHAAGIGIVLNWESYSARAGEGGTSGKADGLEAVRQARALGMPAGFPIVFSVDFNVPATIVPNVLQYLRSAELVTDAAGYRTGAYIKFDLIDQLLANNIATALLWQPYAWAPRGAGDQGVMQHPSAHVFQRLGLVDLAIGGIDENVALRSFDVWHPTINQEAPVADFICTIGSDIVAVSPGGVLPITQTMLGAYTGVPNLGNVTGTDTADRINFYLQHGRWQLPNGTDPGPREAKSTSTVAGPSAADIAKAVNDDAARRMQA